MASGEPRRYRFGPLERRGLIGSLRPAQLVIIAAALVGAVLLMRFLPAGPGIFSALGVALAAAAACFWPVAGRPAEEWLPVAVRHVIRRAKRTHRYRSGAPQAGVSTEAFGRPAPVVSPPRAGRGLELLSAPLGGESVGVVKDRAARSFTAALAVRVTSFGLLDRAEQEVRLAGWGGVLAGLAREGSPVNRTVPADGDEIGRYLGEAWDGNAAPLESVPMQSYLELASRAPAVSRDHELAICLQIGAKRAWRQIKRAGGTNGPDVGACTVLLRELEALGERLAAADVKVIGPLRPGLLASTIRIAFDPWSRPALARLAAADPERDGIDEAGAWPVATEASWSTYRTDGALHATYWIAGWPRGEVGAAFLSPLLLNAQMARAVAVTIESISPIKAIREVEAARTSDLADQELRGRMGFIETARRRRLAEATERREEELADGHAAVRFAGYITVSARDAEELERNCAEIEHAAQMARLELRRLYGQQEEAFTYTLPLCRGLQ